jgi:hypothetical protein
MTPGSFAVCRGPDHGKQGVAEIGGRFQIKAAMRNGLDAVCGNPGNGVVGGQGGISVRSGVVSTERRCFIVLSKQLTV